MFIEACSRSIVRVDFIVFLTLHEIVLFDFVTITETRDAAEDYGLTGA